MQAALFITSGDSAGAQLAQCPFNADLLIWHDILYDGPRNPGWPETSTLEQRAIFIEQHTGGGLHRKLVREVFDDQYEKLRNCTRYNQIVLWFDACLFDQSMLVHILSCMAELDHPPLELLCIDSFDGIEPYHGIGQLTPQQLELSYDRRTIVTQAQIDYACIVDAAFAIQDLVTLQKIARQTDAPIRWIPAAVARWLDEQPDPKTGLRRLQQLALAAIEGGKSSPLAVFREVCERDPAPHYWGDTTLYKEINALADRTPALITITGPTSRLPQWEPSLIDQYRLISIDRTNYND